MSMKKNLLIAAIAITALASCSSNDFVGDESPQGSIGTNGAIQFVSNTPTVTRTSSTDAAKINYLFKVFGVKTVSSSDQRVFATATEGVKPYNVWFVDATANSTTSNSANWEYVGTSGQTYGTSEHTVQLTADQTIKYWDNAASEYNFQAWSDINTSGNEVTISAIDKNTMTITGTPAKLAKLYIADLQTGAPASFTNNVVQFNFRNMAAKVRLGIYETIPGYVVKDLTFHYNDGTAKTSTTNAYLTGSFVGSSSSEQSFTVSYDATSKKAILELSGSGNVTYFDFGTFTSSTSIGTSSTDPTWATGNATYTNVLPNTSNVGAMTLTVDYTLYNSTSGETINVTGQTATVPAAYMSWKPNYAYTYLFKITDDKLTPITLDAVIIDADDGTQETITTISDPSITTYAKASNVTTNNEYLTGSNIYAVVANGTPLTTTTAKLYTATIEAGALQEITETTVANAIAHGTESPTGTWTVTDANGKKLVVKSATGLSVVTEIDANDTPDGVAITVNGAKFTPATPTFTVVATGTSVTSGTTYYTAADGSTKETLTSDGTASENQYWNKTDSSAGYYVFEYTDTNSDKHYKVIKVVDKY